MAAVTTPVRVLVVDDDALVRAALVMMLDGAEGISVVAEAADGAEVPAVLERQPADVVLMDLRMPHVDGVTATRQLLQRPEAPTVLVLTTFDTEEEILGALRAGAGGYLLKDTTPARIAEAVRRAGAGESMLSPAIIRRLVERAVDGDESVRQARHRLAGLTERQREVVAAIGQGLTNAQIAERLYVSSATVKAQVSQVLTALDAGNRTQVAILAHDAGLA